MKIPCYNVVFISQCGADTYPRPFREAPLNPIIHPPSSKSFVCCAGVPGSILSHGTRSCMIILWTIGPIPSPAGPAPAFHVSAHCCPLLRIVEPCYALLSVSVHRCTLLHVAVCGYELLRITKKLTVPLMMGGVRRGDRPVGVSRSGIAKNWTWWRY